MGLKVWLAEVPLLGVLRSGPGDIRLGPDNFPVKQVLRGVRRLAQQTVIADGRMDGKSADKTICRARCAP